MALTGNWTKYTYTEDLENLITNEITYPIDLPEDHINYDKRGTTEEVSNYAIVESSEVIEGIYLHITGLTIEKLYNDFSFKFAYRIYTSQENRIADLNREGGIHTDIVSTTIDLDSLSVNPYSQAYNYLLTQKGFESLIEA